MKISILTWSHTLNFGGSLQTFALQRYLRDQGFDVREIQYSKDNDHIFSNKFLALRSYVWKNTGKKLLADTERVRKFQQFYDENLVYHEKKYDCEEDFYKYNLDSDVFIVGSDQVWNPNIIRNDVIWFLNFTQKKKISYATSFGLTSLPDSFAQFCMPMIDQIDAVSVREKTGSEIIHQYLPSKTVETVIDPVFLLNRDTWANYALPPKQKKYVLCYFMPGNTLIEKKMTTAARTYAKQNGLSVINIGKREYGKLMFWQNNVYGIGQREFLGLFMNAEAVFTNSFHGTAFSIIFRRPFRSFIDSHQNHNNVSSRIEDLLQSLQCHHALVDSDMQDMMPIMLSDEAERTLDDVIDKSKRFLKTAIGE